MRRPAFQFPANDNRPKLRAVLLAVGTMLVLVAGVAVLATL